jgi:hypothetical protein
LEADPRQFMLIRKHPEIHYCLPTFTNRNYRLASLHHCIVWRPTPRARPTRVWYDNPDNRIRKWARRLERHENSYRWGNFVERVQQCKLGLVVTESPVRSYLDSLRSAFLSIQAPPTEVRTVERGEPLLLVNARMEVRQ